MRARSGKPVLIFGVLEIIISFYLDKKSEIDGTKFTSALEESNQTNVVLLPSMLRSAVA